MTSLRNHIWITISQIVIVLQNVNAIGITLEDAKNAKINFNPRVHNDYYMLSMEENVNGTIFFIKVTELADQKPIFEPESSIDCATFLYENAIEVEGEDKFKFVLKKGIDYEQSDCQLLKGKISVPGNHTQFSIDVRNVDDNKPIIEVTDCKMKENTVVTKTDSSCKFVMADADGMMNETKFVVSSNGETSPIFELDFVGSPPKYDVTKTELSLYLKEKVQLDFELLRSHFLNFLAQQPNTKGSFPVVVFVQDMPDMPPVWENIFTAVQFEENEDQMFNLKASDGDVGINNSISYEVKHECKKCKIHFPDPGLGNLVIESVDRELEGDSIKLKVTAKEIDNSTTKDVTFIIIDQDDNFPTIKGMGGEFKDNAYHFKVDEGYQKTISKFSVFDPDLSDNGTFVLEFVDSESEIKYSDAFLIIPNSGYQQGSFELTVINSKKLDYEDPNWQNILLQLKAREKKNEAMSDTKTVIIHLVDINDEPPIFCNDSNNVPVFENITSTQLIFNASATDADQGDVVKYKILKSIWGDKLRIDENGLIYLRDGQKFDYETLQQVSITIQATDDDDTHLVNKVLEIDVKDVNDEPPQIIVGKERLVILENTDNGTSIPNLDVQGFDPDTKPKLVFSIDWSKSVLVKNSIEIDPKEQPWRCFKITTIKNEESDSKVKADIKVDGCEPDFELYDTINIAVILTDENTEEGENSTAATVAINIKNINDNPPVFDPSKLMGLITIDGAKSPSVVGTIQATDRDIDSEIVYSIRPLDPSANWLNISEKTGQIVILPGVEIDDDNPARMALDYEAVAFDGIFNDTKTISIKIIDINDNRPTFKVDATTKSIKEKSASETPIVQLHATDNDRDEPFNKFQFKLNYANVTKDTKMRFSIEKNGLLKVHLRPEVILDRDCEVCPKKYVIPIVVYDNPDDPEEKNQLEDHLDFTVVLEDVNDNAPFITEGELTTMENLLKGEQMDGKISALDIDEEGPNSDIRFILRDIVPNQGNPNLTIGAFEISSRDNKTAAIELLEDLRGRYGDYNLTIETCDYGSPVQCKNNSVKLVVDKFNFEEPTFVFPPKSDYELVLQTNQRVNEDLINIYDKVLQQLEVDDHQGHKWRTHFTCKEKGVKNQLFDISVEKTDAKNGRLITVRDLTEEDLNKKHTLIIEASLKDSTIKGEKKVTVSTTLTVSFLDKTAPPRFDNNTFSFDVDENKMLKNQKIPRAKYGQQNEEILRAFYYLFKGDDSAFVVDEKNGDLTFKEGLDYEETPFVDIQIEANNKSGSSNPHPLNDSILFVNIQVNDLNDNKPQFTQREFKGALLSTSTTDSAIVTVNVTDADSYKDSRKFAFSLGQVSHQGKNIDKIKNPFSIDKLGKITPTFVVSSDMVGFFTFEVTVHDGPDKYGTQFSNVVNVQINIITDDELVEFLFANSDVDLNQKREFIADCINAILPEYKATVAITAYDANKGLTTAKIYFLDQDLEPVKANAIKKKLNDPLIFRKLITKLQKNNVSLINFSQEKTAENTVETLNIWLVVLTSVSTLLLILMSMAFMFKYRALTRRLKNLSTTKFGSIDSGLNRQGISAPNTNRNAVEGSNSLFNPGMIFAKDEEGDQISIGSTDSGLIGIENNPEFNYEKSSTVG